MGSNRLKPRPSFAAAFLLAAVSGVFFMTPLGPPQALAKEPEAPQLGLPIRCFLGKDCWLVNLVDVDPGPGRRDYTCSNRTHDGHKGVDIAIRDLKAMHKGVDVLASAPGVVKGVRDGMKDVDVTIAGAPSVKGRECGNGLVLDHGGGWETQYCHMRRGSLAVGRGDVVKRRQKLGLVGHSGRAQFPHIHLSVRYKNKVIDPFVGLGRTDKCGLGPKPLWREGALAKLGGTTTALYNAGFATAAPKPRAAREGLLGATKLPRDAPALVLWVDMFWVEAGDVLGFRIRGPEGDTIVKRAAKIKKTQARRFTFVGKKRKQGLWPPGTYRGQIVLVRKDKAGAKQRFSAVREVEIR